MKNRFLLRKGIIVLCLAFTSTFPLYAATIVSNTGSVGWSSTSGWVGGIVPSLTDSVIISLGAVMSTGTSQTCGAVNILGTLTLTGGNTLTVAGDGISSFGSVAGNGTLGFVSIGGRNIILNGDWTFSGSQGNSAESITMNGAGNQLLQGVVSTGTLGTGLFTINKPSGQVIMGSNMAFNNNGLKIMSGTLNPNGHLLTITTLAMPGGTVIVDASTWAGNYSITTTNNPSAGNTIQYTAANATVYASITYQNLGFSGSGSAGASGALTLQGSLGNTGGGVLDFGANNVTVSGTVPVVSLAGFATTGSLSITKTAGVATTTGGLNTGPLVINGTGGTLNLGSALNHSVSNVTMTHGTLQGGSSTLNVSGAWSGSGAAFTAGTGTVNFNGAGAQTLPTTPAYYNLTISAAGTTTMATTPLTVTGNLMLSSGATLVTAGVPSSYVLNVGGNWTNNGATFSSTNNTVVLNGATPQTIGGTAGPAFYKLTISNTGGNVILGANTSVSNLLNFTSGSLDATAYSLTMNAGPAAITGISNTRYVITGNGVSPATGKLILNSLPTVIATVFPIGTANYYMPVSVNPGLNTGNSFGAFVYQGVTSDGTSNGSALDATAMSQVLNAVWNLNRSAGSGTALLGFDWSSSGTALEGSLFQTYALNVGVSQYTGSAWQTAIGTGSTVTETAAASFSGFSSFGLGFGGVPLPVKLVDFSAVLNNGIIALSWQADVSGIKSFDIEKSTDGLIWNPIGSVVAKQTTGNANYTFDDRHPANGRNDYRLKLVSTNGHDAYSNIKSIAFATENSLRVYPMPATDHIQVVLGNSSAISFLYLINQSGKIVYEKSSFGNPQAVMIIPVRGYPAGLYTLVIGFPDGRRQTRLIVVMH